jgi:hypothetical protein
MWDILVTRILPIVVALVTAFTLYWSVAASYPELSWFNWLMFFLWVLSVWVISTVAERALILQKLFKRLAGRVGGMIYIALSAILFVVFK